MKHFFAYSNCLIFRMQVYVFGHGPVFIESVSKPRGTTSLEFQECLRSRICSSLKELREVKNCFCAFDLTACTCAVQHESTVRFDDVFLCMSLASHCHHYIFYKHDRRFLKRRRRSLPIFIKSNVICCMRRIQQVDLTVKCLLTSP